MLVGRGDEISLTRRQLDLGSNLLIHGRPRSGKTTFANQVLDGLRVHRVGLVDDLHSLALDLDRAAPSRPLEIEFAERLAAADYDVVLLDMPVAGPLARTFGSLRDTWWSHPVRWVVIVDTGDHVEWTARPADTFFHIVELGPLSGPDAEELLRRRAKRLAPPDAQLLRDTAPMIVRATDRLPGSLVRTARAALAAPDPLTWVQRAAATDDIAESLGPAHQTILQFLRAHGPTSASDPAIQDVVGLTRARIAQVLSDLSDQGLTERQRHGRQVLYRPTEGTSR